MEDIQNKADELIRAWRPAHQALSNNVGAWEANLPGITLEQLDETVKTTCKWFESTKAVVGFRPAFAVSKVLTASTLTQLQSTISQVASGQWTQLQPMIQHLSKALGFLCAIAVFAEKEGSRGAVSKLGAELAQSLTLLDTAQSELSKKMERLAQAEDSAKSIEEKGAEIVELETEAEGICENLRKLKTEADTNTTASTAALDRSKQIEAKIAEHLDSVTSLGGKLAASETKLSELQTRTDEQQKVIKSLLPNATSAGLAHGFNQRFRGLKWTKIGWAIVFFIGIGGLVWVGVNQIAKLDPTMANFWSWLVLRILSAGPLVWLAWFSAIQYGNTVRLQEDYAFKEATSKAFAGYRDHMEHLSDIESEETDSAMKELALRTIFILSQDPLRVLRKSSDDVSPAKCLVDAMRSEPKSESTPPAKPK